MDNSILRNCGITAMSIDITYNCNFRCRHCFNRSGEHCFGERELTDEELMKIIVEVADIAPRSLCICGGEPLLRKDILIKMGKYYTEKTSGRTSLNMVTNGFLITEEVADELKEAGFRTVQVSLDGASAESHEWIRNQPGSFERAKEALRILVDRGFYVGGACTPSKKNLNEIDEIIKIVEEIGVNEFRMQPLMRMGRAKGMSEFFLDDKEYYKLSTKIKKYAIEKKDKLKIEWGDPIEHLLAMTSRFDLKYAAISAYGEIEISPYIPIVFGNLKKHSLEEYLVAGFREIGKYEFPRKLYKLALSPDLLDISYKGHGLPAPHTGENIDFDLIENNLQKLDMDYIKKYRLEEV